MTRTSRPRRVGRTRWRRFLVVGGVGFGTVGLLGYLAASGALAITFAFSGIPFSLKADSLVGTDFVQYAYPDRLASNHGDELEDMAGDLIFEDERDINNIFPDAAGQSQYFASDTITQMKNANIDGLNQVICAPTPLPVAIKVHIVATDRTVARDLTIQSPALRADSAEFRNIIIGLALKDAINRTGVNDPYGALDNPALGNSFAQAADTVILTGIDQVGVGTEAGTFTINGLKLWAEFVGGCE